MRRRTQIFTAWIQILFYNCFSSVHSIGRYTVGTILMRDFEREKLRQRPFKPYIIFKCSIITSKLRCTPLAVGHGARIILYVSNQSFVLVRNITRPRSWRIRVKKKETVFFASSSRVLPPSPSVALICFCISYAPRPIFVFLSAP